MTDFNEIKESLVTLNKEHLLELVNAAIQADTPAANILNKGLISGMDIVGEKRGFYDP
ncbi:MAG: hypothetical protein GY729_01490 [Desulfobacteraceae bacterium]|nr:hypothetical protein [Desulfobacteraceae bacterium]